MTERVGAGCRRGAAEWRVCEGGFGVWSRTRAGAVSLREHGGLSGFNASSTKLHLQTLRNVRYDNGMPLDALRVVLAELAQLQAGYPFRTTVEEVPDGDVHVIQM